MRGVRGEGGGTLMAKIFARVCAQNYYGAQFIAPIRVMIIGPSPDPGPAGEWEGKHGFSKAKTYYENSQCKK